MFFLIWLGFVQAANSFSCTGVKGRISSASALESWVGASSYAQALLASLPLPEKPANFEVVTLRCPEAPRKILFATPKLIQFAPHSVQSIFLRHKCKSIGLLVRRGEAATLQPGHQQQSIFFSQLTVAGCRRAFQGAFGAELRLVLVDVACDCLPAALLQAFEAAQLALFRHPSCFVDDQIFYCTDGRCTEVVGDVEIDSTGWCVDLALSLDFITEYAYRIHARRPGLTAAVAVELPPAPLQLLGDLELEEITLTPSSSNSDDLDYEIIEASDFGDQST